MKTTIMPKAGDLRVWHIPQIPGKPFHVSVPDVATAKVVLNALWDYDRFQLEQRIKGDYSNVSGLECYRQDDEPGWSEWYDPEEGDSISEVMRNEDLAKAMTLA